ncbi:hypothetical protein [Streptomyces longisporoflavus]|uniref:Uncharacterized protein n=1 Tax=Streptomyces longisporoflavus TaxID=28044 RepID=A0ABW7R339_9ACTN
MTYATEHLMDLAALGRATSAGDELLRLLREGHALYHEGLTETRLAVAEQHQATSDHEVFALARQAGMPPFEGATREEALGLLALARWQETPAALAYASLAEHAARHGVSLVPE